MSFMEPMGVSSIKGSVSFYSGEEARGLNLCLHLMTLLNSLFLRSVFSAPACELSSFCFCFSFNFLLTGFFIPRLGLGCFCVLCVSSEGASLPSLSERLLGPEPHASPLPYLRLLLGLLFMRRHVGVQILSKVVH